MDSLTSITVAVGQFEDLVARGLRGLIEDDPSLELVATDITHERLPAVLRAHRPSVAIVNFGSLRDPFEIRQLSAENPATHLVVLANRPSPTECAQLLAFGASACVAKSTQARDILNAIHLASRGMQLAPHKTHGAQAIGSELLTLRESDVLAQLQQRRSNAQIAAELHISVETVRTHARNIYRKLGVASRRDLLTPPAVVHDVRTPSAVVHDVRTASRIPARRRRLRAVS
jgi:DNA-binding NarL/FixJ family response regulator